MHPQHPLVVKLYQQEGCSGPEIAKRLAISMWVVYSILKQSGIKRRTLQSANQVWFSKKPLTFSTLQHFSLEQRDLKVLGLTLYWAEGSKRSDDTVDLANSDPQIIRLFVRFLRVIYQVTEKKFRVLLYCYSNQPIPRLISYWSEITEIPKDQFTKPYVRKDFDPRKSQRMPHGLVHIRYSDKKLLFQVMQDIERLQNQMLGFGSG